MLFFITSSEELIVLHYSSLSLSVLQWLCIPFAMTHESVTPVFDSTLWFGEWDPKYSGVWIDYALLLVSATSSLLLLHPARPTPPLPYIVFILS